MEHILQDKTTTESRGEASSTTPPLQTPPSSAKHISQWKLPPGRGGGGGGGLCAKTNSNKPAVQRRGPFFPLARTITVTINKHYYHKTPPNCSLHRDGAADFSRPPTTAVQNPATHKSQHANRLRQPPRSPSPPPPPPHSPISKQKKKPRPTRKHAPRPTSTRTKRPGSKHCDTLLLPRVVS